MAFFRKFFALSAFLLSLVLLNPHNLLAIGEEAPIVALINNNIYFVSPSRDEARLIVARDPEKDALLTDIYAGAELELGPMSPDNTTFAYTAPLYEMFDLDFDKRKLSEIADLRPRELSIVDVATGKVTPITDQGANFADVVKNDGLTNISNLTWSIDGQRLYFLASVRSLRNRVTRNTIEYYDMASGQQHVLVKLNSQVQVIGLYAMFTDLLLLDGPQNQGNYRFIQYNNDGDMVNSVDMPVTGLMDCTNELMFDMNPIFSTDQIDYYYGYYLFKEETGEMLPSLLDVSRNTSVSLEEDFFPALISQANPIHSLRAVFNGACGDNVYGRWELADAAGESIDGAYLPEIDFVSQFASQVALSPDGHSVAMLNGDTIRIIDVNSDTMHMRHIGDISIPELEDNATHELHFWATQILWGSMNVTFARIIRHG